MSEVELEDFVPEEAVIGGIFIGVGTALYMLLAASVAGSSGAVKALVLLRTTDYGLIAFACGLMLAGLVCVRIMPHLIFESPTPTHVHFLGGFAVGVGTSLGNGCTSGHGLCGISRLSMRSYIAVPVFLATAIASATVKAGLPFERLTFVWPPALTPHRTRVAGYSALGLSVALMILLHGLHTDSSYRFCETPPPTAKAAIGLWCGTCVGFGLSFGGMVKPSEVASALTISKPVNLTLWVLFATALAVTFTLYRIAEHVGVRNARIDASRPAKIDRALILGSMTFGAGWGAADFCPGPLLVSVAATPLAIAPLSCLAGVTLGVHVADSFAAPSAFSSPLVAAVERNEGEAKVQAAKQNAEGRSML